jgi:hypothetical protein
MVWDDSEIGELARSIKEHGLQEPIPDQQSSFIRFSQAGHLTLRHTMPERRPVNGVDQLGSAWRVMAYIKRKGDPYK